MDKEEQLKIIRKALEIFLSGKQNPGSEPSILWEQIREKLTEEEKIQFEELIEDVSTQGLRERGKRGIVTPRQTVRIDEADWKKFIHKCRSRGSTASEVIRKFIKRTISD